jgi:NAD(P)-dependent dehydrogenase (short-subunit alcohol dehydrogenase family)
MSSPLPNLSGTALVTGGSRGVGANIARELARARMEVAIAARTADQVEAVANEIGGRAYVGDVSVQEDVERWFADLGDIDLLVCSAGIYGPQETFASIDDWWRVFEVNVRGVYLCCNAAAVRMITRGGGRIVILSSNAAFSPLTHETSATAYHASKAAAHRLTERLATSLAAENVFVFSVSPGFVRTAMTEDLSITGRQWTSPDCAPRLVRALASGEFDALTGRYLHAERDAPEVLRDRVSAILADDLNTVRLRR